MTSFTLEDLAKKLGAELIGDGTKEITSVRPLDSAGAADLSFLHNSRYVAQARESKAAAVLVEDAAVLAGRDVLVCEHPYLAFARALEIFFPADRPDAGVHASAVVADDAVLGDGVTIGPQAVVGPGCRVGARTIVGAGTVLGRGAQVGEDCELHPRVVIEDRCEVGDRCIFHSGVVIGSDGYGFATVDGVHHKVPQVGRVVIEDDVELGANVCVDRATFGETRIGRGTKVDNLVQIAHNVQVGEGCLLVAQVGISGSTTIGHHSVFAGQSGAAGHLKVGERVIIGAKTAVYKDVPDGAFYTGIPARPHREWLALQANQQKIPAVRKKLKELEAAVAKLNDSQGDS